MDRTLWLTFAVVAMFISLLAAIAIEHTPLAIAALFALVLALRWQRREEARRLHGVRKRRRRR